MTNNTNSSDVPLEAPRLLQLAASAIDADALLQNIASNVHLPIAASRELFYKQKQHCIKNKLPIREGLRPWCDSTRLPLDKLDLAGAQLDDVFFVDLVAAHQDKISELDLTNIQGLSEDINSILDTRRVRLPQLRALRVTSMELLSRPQPRRKNGVAGMETRNVPVLGVEDLEGAAGLDQMRESRGGPSREALQMHSDDNNLELQRQSCSTSLSQHFFNDDDGEPPVFTSRCPNIKLLSLQKVKRPPEEEDPASNATLSRVFEPLKDLEVLDLSNWSRMEDLRCINPLNLTSLILFDVPDLYLAIGTITQMSHLKMLDVSQSMRETALYPRPVTALHSLVTALRHLTHLDISSTNLAAQPTANDWPNVENKESNNQHGVRSDIVGLRALDRPLTYLGLFNCDNASHFAEIPARHISGDANEDQVITALYMYKERSGLLQSVLNESYQLYRFGNSNPLVRHTEALHLVLDAMLRHLEDSTLQIAGSASLFYIIRRVDMNRDTKKRVVAALLSGMETHMEEQVMVRNCCLSLCQFEIPQDILFDYSRLAILLVTVLQHHNADNLTQRIVVFLLNSMACHVEGDQKVQVGSFGAIEMILDQIRRKLTSNVCDDVMEVGWSFLWNITDETPVNCERFLKADGLSLFQKCFDAFKTERELVRNMMGLIGNIAEVDDLRKQLMQDEYVEIFCQLLAHVEESIEISYNSAGVLAHMVSDGDEAWRMLKVKRTDVMDKIVTATENWRLDTRRFINYRSFRPILRLLPLWHAYASQHWAVWALANLTTTDGQKYCAYVTDEGGVPLLEELVNDSRTTKKIKELAKTVLSNIDKYNEQRLNGLLSDDSLRDYADAEESMET